MCDVGGVSTLLPVLLWMSAGNVDDEEEDARLEDGATNILMDSWRL